jgi:glycosyltransferase involved in cell wall biosynthesis
MSKAERVSSRRRDRAEHSSGVSSEEIARADEPEICHINLARGFRGGERQTELLIRSLAENVPRQRLIARAGAPLTHRLRDVSGLTVTPVGGRLSAVAATAQAALIHAHESHGAQVALIRNLISRTPYVITRRVVSALSSSPVTRAMYRRASRIIVLSRAIERVLTGYEPRIDCVRIPGARAGFEIDCEWVAAFRARHAGRFLVGHVGAYDFRHKGQDVLVEAARALAQRHPELHFVLVGSGRDQARLTELAAQAGNVTIAGWADNVGDYLAAFDLFVFPSIHEGLGSILFDAMQFGLPVVASDVDGIPDLIADRENGLLVPPGDAAALADAIAALYSSSALRESLGAANRIKAQEFLPASMARRYLAVYAEIAPQIAAARAS